VARKLRAMLDDPDFAVRAQSVAQQIAAEDGVKTACDALEVLYAKVCNKTIEATASRP
jgi:UDP:flavonoid glycosyltransferase YjiC (YdhE family)